MVATPTKKQTATKPRTSSTVRTRRVNPGIIAGETTLADIKSAKTARDKAADPERELAKTIDEPTETIAAKVTRKAKASAQKHSEDAGNSKRTRTVDKSNWPDVKNGETVAQLRCTRCGDDVIFNALESQNAFSRLPVTGITDREAFDTVSARC
jgi:hypothetical protein